MTTYLRNVSPLGDLSVPFVGFVPAGGYFAVDDTRAGKPPTDFTEVDPEDPEQPAPHLVREVVEDGIVVRREAYDPGTGLLQQAEHYEKATKKAHDEWLKSREDAAKAGDGATTATPAPATPGGNQNPEA